ncbi:hypothetical protein J6590_055809 [Homalodisca vitripennis]|nr:hypothetical protein J6590_055809 [Homalodisca vitripennis]
MEDKGRNGLRKPPRPGQEMLKKHPGPPAPGPIGTGMSRIGHPATKLCQQQTRYEKVTLKIKLPAKWLTNLVEGEGQGPPPAQQAKTPKAQENRAGAFYKNTKCLITQTKRDKIKLLGREELNRGGKHPPPQKDPQKFYN